MGCVLGSRTAASSPVSEGSLRLTHVRLMSGSILPKADMSHRRSYAISGGLDEASLYLIPSLPFPDRMRADFLMEGIGHLFVFTFTA